MKSCALAAVVLVVMPSVLFAQQFGEPPVVRAIAAKQTLPPDGAFDLRGISLGMTPEEAEGVIKAFAPSSKANRKVVDLGLRDARGNAVGFKYLQSVELSVENTDEKSTESVMIVFTSGLTEARVTHIQRRLRYASEATMASVPALVDGLSKKFGPPSYDYRGNRSVKLSWVWFQNKLVSTAPNDPRRRLFMGGARGTPEGCLGKADYGWTYSFDQKREDPAPGCSVILSVDIFTGTAQDLVQTVSFDLVDKTRFMESARVSDKWLLDEMNRKAGAQAPRAGPPL